MQIIFNNPATFQKPILALTFVTYKLTVYYLFKRD